MSQKTLLVTGGAGFIGSNFIPYMLETNPEARIINVDKLTYAGKLENLREVESNDRYTFVRGDIADGPFIEKLFHEYQFDGVIHFAAESHVDNSIKNPSAFIETNIIGTFELLKAAYNLWMEKPFKTKSKFQNARFHHISTDEVYGSLGAEGYFTETTPYAPNSPYSASKASSDMLVRSYFHTYGLNVITTNCSNNYGPKQHPEKLIPTIIRNALAGNNIPIYGNGTNVRDWLFVTDHCSAVAKVFASGKSGETYNVGGDNEIANIDICKKICAHLDTLKPKKESYAKQITFVEDRPGHDFRYAIDCSKIKKELSWKQAKTFDQGLLDTIKWYL